MQTTIVSTEIEYITKRVQSAEKWMGFSQDHEKALTQLWAARFAIEQAIEKISQDQKAVVA